MFVFFKNYVEMWKTRVWTQLTLEDTSFTINNTLSVSKWQQWKQVTQGINSLKYGINSLTVI